jgi:hypothetical protein
MVPLNPSGVAGQKSPPVQRVRELSIGIARGEEGDRSVAFSYAREELAGGPLLKGRRKRGATMYWGAWAKLLAEASTSGALSSEIGAVAIPVGELPELQSPRQLHWRDWLLLL